MKIYCSRINNFHTDTENGNGDLEALQYFMNTGYWGLTTRTSDMEVYEKIKDIKDGKYLCDYITIFYPTNENWYDSEGNLDIDDTIGVSINHDYWQWINKYGTFIRPFQILTDEEVQEFIDKYHME